jgi:ribonuclease HI
MNSGSSDKPPRSFICSVCGEPFSLPAAVQERYPGWSPKKCRRCHDGKPGEGKPARSSHAPRAASGPPLEVSSDSGETQIPERLQQELDVVLSQYHDGPQDGIFTDGGCSGNPGPGGWGAVYVRNNQIVRQCFGREAHTTNNRMELMALDAAFEMIVADEEVTIWSDSQLCVNTLTQWARKWEANGWRKKGGPIKNLDLIQPLYAKVQAHPCAALRWVKAHAGNRWNEYVDTLATAFLS